MNTCDTCKWWSDEEVPDTTHRYCHKHESNNKYEEDGASISSDFLHGMSTGPKFGCIHHAPK